MTSNEVSPETRTWPDPLRYIVLVLFMAAIILGVYLARGSMGIILIAVVISYILTPMVHFLIRKAHMKRTLAVIISYLFLISVVVIFFLLVIPYITTQLTTFITTDWGLVIQSLDRFLEDLIRQMEVNKLDLRSFKVDLTVPLIELRKMLNNIDPGNINVSSLFLDVQAVIQSIVSVSANVIGRAFSILIAVLTTLMTSIHLCTDGFKLKGLIVKQFPIRYRPEIYELLSRLKRVWNNYFVGQIKLMLWVGGLTTIITFGLGLRWVLVLGIIAGLLEVIPNIGPILAFIPAAFSAAIFGSKWIPLNNFSIVLIVIGAYILIQQVENVLIVPKVMGNALEIHPVAVILGILILSSRIGFIGALIAAPVIGLLKVVMGFIISKLRGEDPYPELYLPKEEAELAND